VKFDIKHDEVLESFARHKAWRGDKWYVELNCDLTVAALIMDTVEAVSTFSIKSRFYCKPGSDASKIKAGCPICNTPPFYYGHTASQLSTAHSTRRTVALTESIRRRTAEDRDMAGEHLRIQLEVLLQAQSPTTDNPSTHEYYEH